MEHPVITMCLAFSLNTSFSPSVSADASATSPAAPAPGPLSRRAPSGQDGQVRASLRTQVRAQPLLGRSKAAVSTAAAGDDGRTGHNGPFACSPAAASTNFGRGGRGAFEAGALPAAAIEPHLRRSQARGWFARKRKPNNFAISEHGEEQPRWSG